VSSVEEAEAKRQITYAEAMQERLKEKAFQLRREAEALDALAYAIGQPRHRMDWVGQEILAEYIEKWFVP